MASSHPCVCTVFTAYIEMHGGRLAVRNQANQVVIFAGRADMTTGILRQNSLANAKTGESFALNIFAGM